jgi:hypothetical protein
MQKNNVGLQQKLFLWEIFENHSPKFRVFGLGLPDLECLLLHVAKQQTDYKLFFNYPTRPGLARFSCGWLPVWLHHKMGKKTLNFGALHSKMNVSSIQWHLTYCGLH